MATQVVPNGSTKNDSTPAENDWTKPAAMAIPKEGFFKKEDGRYGPVFSRSSACYSFTIIAKIIPEQEPVFYEYSQAPPPAMGALPYQRRKLLHVPGFFDTDFDKYTEAAVSLYRTLGINTVFENLEGFPEDWETNAPAFIKIDSSNA